MSHPKFIIQSKPKDLGDNFFVRRALPTMQKKMVGPYVFWDHMGPAQVSPDKPMVVRAHPHIGLSTITWLFSGKILHRDSLGNEQFIVPGEVNWMTSGNGIVHSERCQPSDESYQLEGIQLWLALPIDEEDREANFFHCKQEQLPVIEKDDLKIKLIAGEAFGHKSPVPVYSKLFYMDIHTSKGTHFDFQLEEQEEGALYIVNGEVEAGGKTYQRFDMLIFDINDHLHLKLAPNTHVMFFGGRVFPEPRHVWWNFVSSSSDKIERAKKRWEQQEFGQVINESEFIPLPNK
jgi:redox-sensitive bicupin YhaK (pirin superfamily)